MKFKRVTMLVLVISLVGAGTIFADSVYEKYQARKITIQLNGTTIDNPGLVVDFGKESRSMAPLRDLTSSLGGIIQYDEADELVNIVKPNVQLSLLGAKDKRTYGTFEKGQTYDLTLLAQIDNLTTSINAIKVTIVDPFKAEVFENTGNIKEHGDYFWYQVPLELKFKYSGKYIIQFSMRTADEEYYKVGELTVSSVAR